MKGIFLVGSHLPVAKSATSCSNVSLFIHTAYAECQRRPSSLIRKEQGTAPQSKERTFSKLPPNVGMLKYWWRNMTAGMFYQKNRVAEEQSGRRIKWVKR